jgi:hypothetical protein
MILDAARQKIARIREELKRLFFKYQEHSLNTSTNRSNCSFPDPTAALENRCCGAAGRFDRANQEGRDRRLLAVKSSDSTVADVNPLGL